MKNKYEFLLAFNLELILLISILLISSNKALNIIIIIASSLFLLQYLIGLILFFTNHCCKKNDLNDDLIKLIICKSNIDLCKSTEIAISKKSDSYTLKVAPNKDE